MFALLNSSEHSPVTPPRDVITQESDVLLYQHSTNRFDTFAFCRLNSSHGMAVWKFEYADQVNTYSPNKTKNEDYFASAMRLMMQNRMPPPVGPLFSSPGFHQRVSLMVYSFFAQAMCMESFQLLLPFPPLHSFDCFR